MAPVGFARSEVKVIASHEAHLSTPVEHEEASLVGMAVFVGAVGVLVTPTFRRVRIYS